MADTCFTSEELVQACNKIIVYAGLAARVANVEEVKAVVSSTTLLVAALESFLGRRVENVLRTTTSPGDRAYNFNVVVDVLSHILSCDLSHISGQRIVEGFLEDISNVLELLGALCQGKPLAGPPSAIPPDAAYTNQPGPGDDGASSSATSEGFDARWPSCSIDESDDGGSVSRSSRGYASGQEPGKLLEDAEEAAEAAFRHDHGQVDQRRMSIRPSGVDQQLEPQAAAPTAPSAGVGVRLRRRKSSSSSGSGRRQRAASLHRSVLAGSLQHHHVPLSPIQEVSREGWENSRASKSGLQSAEGGRGSPTGARASPRYHPYGSADGRRSVGDASSIISVPSLRQDDLRRTTSSPDSGGARVLLRQQQEREPSPDLTDGGDDASISAAAPSSYSDGTSTLLERAMSHAEGTLRNLGKGYEDFYFEDDHYEADRAAMWGRQRARKQLLQQQSGRRGQPRPTSSTDGGSGSGSARAGKRSGGGPTAYEPAGRTVRAADSQSGQVQQHQAFLRRVKRALLTANGAATRASTTTTTSVGVPPSSVSGSGSRTRPAAGSGSGSRTSKPSSARTPRRSAGRRQGKAGTAGAGSDVAVASGRAGIRARRQWSYRGGAAASGAVGGDGPHEVLLQTLREVVGPVGADVSAAQARKLVQRAPEAGAELAKGLGNAYGDADALTGLAPEARPALQLNPDLARKLRSLYRLMMDDPKHREARAAVETLSLADDMLRHARRRAMVERLANARARRDSALRSTSERLREQGQEYDKRVEQLRLQRLASEWASSQRSAQMRHALAAEAALRDTFLRVLREEKEVLLAEQRDARANASAAFPIYKDALRKAEQDFEEVIQLLERLLAEERQHRVRSDRETLQAQRHYGRLAAAVVLDRLQELLGRVAREDAAAVERRSLVTQPKARRALMEQIRRLLALPRRHAQAPSPGD